MNDLERAEQLEKAPLTKVGKLMVFVQVFATISLVIGFFTTIAPLIQMIIIVIGFIVILIVTLISIGLIWISEGFRAFVVKLIDGVDLIPSIMKIGIYSYSIAIFLGLVSFLYFVINPKIRIRKGHYLYSIIIIVAAIALLLIHVFVALPKYQI